MSKADLDIWTTELAPSLPPLTGVNSLAMIRAICWQESSYGTNAIPRHEDGWCPNVRYGLSKLARQRHTDHGCLVCMAYGPMQALYHSLADLGLTSDPATLLDQRHAFNLSVQLLSNKISSQHPTSVIQVADLWNSGTWRDNIVPYSYVSGVSSYYNTELARL